jgi:CRISPR-associated endonuclease/helicase Cas3
MFYAHSGPSRDRWEPLSEHLRDVARLAREHAAVFGAGEEAYLAGLLHDLGKYSETFTRRLEGKEHGLDHWSLGAWAALAVYKQKGLAAALAIQGHHVGLQRANKDSLGELRPEFLAARHPLGLRLTEGRLEPLLERLRLDGIALPPPPASGYAFTGPPGAGMLDVRMLFSALVDADFLETEAHFRRAPDGAKWHRPAGLPLQAPVALTLLEGHLKNLAQTTRAAPEVSGLRADLLRDCLESGSLPRSLFTLSAPTGAGKTLAMLAFALRHAQEHGLRRIVVAIPFLSILEQTARVYKNLFEPVFGSHYVLEHHSLAGTRREPGEGKGEADPQSEERRMGGWLRENWDAPLIVTTSVQILESLFANRPSACRKLHRLADSVILFDEVQTLPPKLAVPTLAALSRMAERYGSSVVFSTATQPAFDSFHERVRGFSPGGWRPREIVISAQDLFQRTRRFEVDWDLEPPRSWESIAQELADHRQALCIVNLKRHALALAGLLKQRKLPGLFHLSTNMCPAHREQALAKVRHRLDAKEPCVLISTQCVEAGVDVDFPVVYRALAPLEAIAQAAGRCNRNGRLPGRGLVKVFVPEDEGYPPGAYGQAASIASALFQSRGSEGMDLQSAELFRLYYQMFYELTGVAESDRGKAKKLDEAIRRQDFVETAELYRLIEQDAISVLMPFDEVAFGALTARLRKEGRLTAEWIQDARAHTVSLIRPKDDDPVQRFLNPAPVGKGETSDDWFVYLNADHYDRQLLGFTGAEDSWIA